MLIRLIILYLSLASFSALATKTTTNKTLTIYHDADYSLNQVSAQAMKMGLLTAFDEVDNEIQGYSLVFKEKNHRGNSKRSLLSMKDFINDEKALFILGGLHSPPYIKNRTFINENQIPLLVPWAAGGPITRYPSSDNWVFRLSIDDTKAGIRISEFALNKLSCKNPHLLLEDTPWGKSNQRTMSTYLKKKVPFGLSLFGWNIKENSARIMIRNIISAGHDCVFLVGNFNETKQFVNAMAVMEKDKIIPIISHWGATGGDIDSIFTKKIKQSLSFHFIQSCYSLASSTQSSFQHSAIARAKKLFPQEFTSPETVKAPAGFIHAYDLSRLAIAALQQIKLSGNIKQDRLLFKQALESLQQPVQGLIKEYDKPFSTWSEQQQDAHEALRLENFCMANFGESNQIDVIVN
jgi:branched-chain amino acid transport system substrate-binding protein